MSDGPDSIAAAQAHLAEEFQLFDDWMDRYQLLVDLGKALEPMPDALKTDATLVQRLRELQASEVLPA